VRKSASKLISIYTAQAALKSTRAHKYAGTSFNIARGADIINIAG
jgi:hypothetical protein